MSRALEPCSSCGRHVRASDGACPFCGTKRRSSLAVAGALVLGVVGGCAESSPGPAAPNGSAGAGASAAPTGEPTAVASAPPPEPTQEPSAQPTQQPTQQPTAEPRPVAEYGMPRPIRTKYGMPRP